jgi:hypothetical protein
MEGGRVCSLTIETQPQMHYDQASSYFAIPQGQEEFYPEKHALISNDWWLER